MRGFKKQENGLKGQDSQDIGSTRTNDTPTSKESTPTSQDQQVKGIGQSPTEEQQRVIHIIPDTNDPKTQEKEVDINKYQDIIRPENPIQAIG